MKVYVLFHHYEDDPSVMPNAVAVWDEYLADNAGIDAWEEEMAKAKASMGPGSYREAVLDVPDRDVLALFSPAAPMKASVADVPTR